MKRFELVFLICLLGAICIALSLIPSIGAEEKEGKNVRFRWALGAIVGPKNDRRLVAITRATVLKTGDELKMLVELQSSCFVYVIYYSKKDEIELLFPYKLEQFTKDYEASKKYYIPKGDMWFRLDKDVGRETFYLLASAKRLSGLESVLEKYQLAEKAKRDALVKEILNEIRVIKRQNRKFTTVAERPVRLGGGVRGTAIDKKQFPPDIDPIANEISTDNFYCRTFTIDHQ
jgi:hypothetical protein